MLTREQLKGMWVSVPTEWDEDGDFDERTFRDQVAMLIDAEPHGLFTTGTTGEFYALDWEEFRAVTDAFLAETAGRIRVQVGGAGHVYVVVHDEPRFLPRLLQEVCREPLHRGDHHGEADGPVAATGGDAAVRCGIRRSNVGQGLRRDERLAARESPDTRAL